MVVVPSRGCLALLGALMFLGGLACTSRAGETPLTTELVASGLDSPVFVTHAPDDFERIFIVEQTGRIRILNNGQLNDSPFIDLRTSVRSGGEQGLLGLAFHPDYQVNGFFYVNYTTRESLTIVAQFRVSSDPDFANSSSEQVLLSIQQPATNHNGGWLSFGPDGYLYIATGDGGSQSDPNNRGQTITNNLLGKILRIDVNGDDFPTDPSRNYAIPADNPFVGVTGDDEIWAYGLRNPWRCSFDRLTGDLYIADVGQGLIEEVDFQPASSLGGENYGWRCMEGTMCTPQDGCLCNDPELTLPVHEYNHLFGRCSITGGEVYRGCAIPELQGDYFFADFCSNQIWSMHSSDQSMVVTERTQELAPGDGLNLRGISSFGTDAFGEIYICDLTDGEVFKIIPAVAPGPLSVVSSDPPNGAIDARQPHGPDETVTAGGWSSISLTLSGCVDRFNEGDVIVAETGAGNPPSVSSVDWVGSGEVRINFDRAITLGEWTFILPLLGGEMISMGWLPGDVSGDRISSTADVTALMEILVTTKLKTPLWMADVDASGSITSADLLRLIDLLNGSALYGSYDGATLP